MADDTEMGSLLRAGREAMGLSREALSEKTGVSVNTIVRYEKGEIAKVAELDALLVALDLKGPPPAGSGDADEPRPPCPELGKALRAARERTGYSQSKVAALAGVSRVTLAKYEAGWGTKLPELYQIASALGMKLQVALWPRDGNAAQAAL